MIILALKALYQYITKNPIKASLTGFLFMRGINVSKRDKTGLGTKTG